MSWIIKMSYIIYTKPKTIAIGQLWKVADRREDDSFAILKVNELFELFDPAVECLIIQDNNYCGKKINDTWNIYNRTLLTHSRCYYLGPKVRCEICYDQKT